MPSPRDRFRRFGHSPNMRAYVHIIALSTAVLACDPGQEPDESDSNSAGDSSGSDPSSASEGSGSSKTGSGESAAGTEASTSEASEAGSSSDATASNESSTDDTDESSDASSGGEQCPEAHTGIAATYSIAYTNFPEIDGDELVVPSLQGVRLETECTVTHLAYADEQLTLTVDCEVASGSRDDETRQIAVTTVATGLPAEVAEGDNVRVFLWLFENPGGRAPRKQGRVPILSLNSRTLTISDASGPILVTGHGGSQGEYPPISLDERLDCEGVELCRGDPGVYAGHVMATTSTEHQRIEVGQTVAIADNETSWQMTLFQSRIDADDCHGLNRGGFSLVRAPRNTP